MKGKVLYASRENCRGVIFEITIHVTQKGFSTSVVLCSNCE